MITLRNWYLFHCEGMILGRGTVSGHPKLRTDQFARTSAVMQAGVEDELLCMTTFSGNHYILEPEWFDPRRLEETSACLAELGIGGDFAERCVRAREEADARRLEEAALEPGELLLEMVELTALRAFFRTAEGKLVSLKPQVHGGMFQDSVLITDWEGGTVDFRYFPKHLWMNPYHVSDGLHTIKFYNLGSRDVLFGQEKRVACKAGAITAIPAAEHDKERLFSPDAVNGKGLYQTMLNSKEEKRHETKQ